MDHSRGRPVSWIEHRNLPAEIAASSVASAENLRRLLPDAIRSAEDAGLSIIAHHLGKALKLAEKVAGAGAAEKGEAGSRSGSLP